MTASSRPPGTSTKWTMGMGSAITATATNAPKTTAARFNRSAVESSATSARAGAGGVPKPCSRSSMVLRFTPGPADTS